MDEAERLCHRLAIMDHGRKIAEGAPRELIAQHIEPQVVEVYGDGAEGWAERVRRASCRALREDRRDGVLLHARCRSAGARRSSASRTLRYLHRPANLEDVFLKLTGRELRD